MSTYTVTILTGTKPSTLVGAIADLQDVLDWIEEEMRDGIGMPSADEILDRIDGQHPEDVEFKVIRTVAGRLGLAIAAESFTETDAMDKYDVVEPAVLA